MSDRHGKRKRKKIKRKTEQKTNNEIAAERKSTTQTTHKFAQTILKPFEFSMKKLMIDLVTWLKERTIFKDHVNQVMAIRGECIVR